MFQELLFAIRYAFIKGEIVEGIFTMGWGLFRTRDLGEDAICLLDKLVLRREPFDYRHPPTESKDPKELLPRLPRITVQPLLELLNKLASTEEVAIAQCDIYLAAIEGRALRLLPLSRKERLPHSPFQAGCRLSERGSEIVPALPRRR